MSKKKIHGVVFSFLGITDGSVIPSVRLARRVGERLGVPVTDYKTFLQEWASDGEKILFLVNGAYSFCKILQELGDAVRSATRIVWIQQDYTIVPPIDDGQATSPFRRAFVERREAGKPSMDFWTTCSKNKEKTPCSCYVNWNSLAWNPLPEKTRKKIRASATQDLFYYGSYREGRTRYLDRYLRMGLDATVSSPGRGDAPNERFALAYPDATHVPKISGALEPELARHGLGLYVEDRRSHSEFHSPANRFYEMLGAGLPMVFQPECAGTFRKAGMDVSEWTASTGQRVREMMGRREEIGGQQRESLTKDFRGELETQIDQAITKLEDVL